MFSRPCFFRKSSRATSSIFVVFNSKSISSFRLISWTSRSFKWMSHRHFKCHMRETGIGIPEASTWYQPIHKPGSHDILPSSFHAYDHRLSSPQRCLPGPPCSFSWCCCPAASPHYSQPMQLKYPNRFLMLTLPACYPNLYWDHFWKNQRQPVRSLNL